MAARQSTLWNLSWTQRRKLTGLLFVTPTVVFVTVFFIIPLLMTIFMSFHDWPLFGERAFTGLENYQELGKDRQYLKSLDFTFRYTALVTPPIFILGFILASLVRRNIRYIGIFRTIFFMPVVIGLAYPACSGSGCWTTASAYSTRSCWT